MKTTHPFDLANIHDPAAGFAAGSATMKMAREAERLMEQARGRPGILDDFLATTALSDMPSAASAYIGVGAADRIEEDVAKALGQVGAGLGVSGVNTASASLAEAMKAVRSTVEVDALTVSTFDGSLGRMAEIEAQMRDDFDRIERGRLEHAVPAVWHAPRNPLDDTNSLLSEMTDRLDRQAELARAQVEAVTALTHATIEGARQAREDAEVAKKEARHSRRWTYIAVGSSIFVGLLPVALSLL